MRRSDKADVACSNHAGPTIFNPFSNLCKNLLVKSMNHYTGDSELGVTVFKFEFPGSVEDFVEKVNNWMTFTEEGSRYQIKNKDEDMILKIQRGMGVLTAPIVFEFRIGSVIGLSIDVLVRGYTSLFGLNMLKQGISSDALIGALPRRNGWKDMLKLLDHLQVAHYDHKFE